MTDTLQNYTLEISKEELADLPVVEYTNGVKVVNTAAELAKAIKILKKYDLLGFDTETKPIFKKGATSHVSLIQIATKDVCFLIRTKKIKDIEPLREILEDSHILKIGLSLHDDFNTLSHDFNFHPQGFVDLQKIVPLYNFSDVGLQKIYAILFGERISKSQRLSNWNADELTDAQISYAAIDAWACIRIYEKLSDAGFDPASCKFKKYIAEETDEN